MGRRAQATQHDYGRIGIHLESQDRRQLTGRGAQKNNKEEKACKVLSSEEVAFFTAEKQANFFSLFPYLPGSFSLSSSKVLVLAASVMGMQE